MTMQTCSVSGCGSPGMNRGKTDLCSRHYQRLRRGVANWDELPPTDCLRCGAPLPPTGRGGRISAYCAPCRPAARREKATIYNRKYRTRRRRHADNAL